MSHLLPTDPHHPDAKIMALMVEIRAAEQRHVTAVANYSKAETDRGSDLKPYDDAVKAAQEECEKLDKRLAGMKARTIAGVSAKLTRAMELQGAGITYDDLGKPVLPQLASRHFVSDRLILAAARDAERCAAAP